MPDKPLVTIGLPVYNSETYLRQSLDSLLAQTYANFVLIISDNASTDGTADICDGYVRVDSRIRYHRNSENIGLPRNFNQIAKLTETKYLKWSTSDDYWGPTFVEKALNVMEQDPNIIVCYPKTTLIDKNGENPRPYEDNLHLMQDDPTERFREFYSRIGLVNATLGLIRVSLLRQTHLYPNHVGSDISLLAEMTLFGKFYELPDRLFFRRFHPKASSGKRGDADHVKKYYYAAKEKNPSFLQWRVQYVDLRSIWSASMPISKKLGLIVWSSSRFCLRQLKRLVLRVIALGRSIAVR
jgi:glycosyltransferase involved in cell wall biosynthesis